MKNINLILALTVISIASACLIVGCSGKIQSGELIGVYQASYSGVVDTIQLSSDGTFSQSVSLKSGKVFNNTSKWTYDSKKSSVFLSNVLSVSVVGAMPPKISNFSWDLPVERSDGTIRLVISEDYESYFEKIS